VKLRSIKDTITLIPFGDVHRDSSAHASAEWEKFLSHAQTVKNPLFLGMGDYMDGFSTSEREIIYSGGLHDSTRKRNEKDERARIRSFAKEVSFMRGRMVGIMNGNHYQVYRDGTNGDQYLANELGAKYLGVCCCIRVQLEFAGKCTALTIVAHHGRGAGTTAGGRMNSVEKLAAFFPEADIALMGDNHARGALPLGDKLTLVRSSQRNGYELKSRKTYIGRTGSFLKGYEPGESSYVVDACLPPASLGWIEFQIGATRTGNSIDLEIKSIQ
jgi:hypothetical protein